MDLHEKWTIHFIKSVVVVVFHIERRLLASSCLCLWNKAIPTGRNVAKFLFLEFVINFPSHSDFVKKSDKITDHSYYYTYMIVIQTDEVEERGENLLYRTTQKFTSHSIFNLATQESRDTCTTSI